MNEPQRAGSGADSVLVPRDGGPGPVDAVCVGETMALLVPDGHAAAGPAADTAPVFRAEVGGAESNVAVHLARSGRPVAWRSALGDDPFGQRIRDRLGAAGVRCAVRTDRERPTGLYMKEPTPDGTRVRYWRRGSAASALGREDAAEVWRLRPRLVHTSGITAALSASAHGLVEELLDRAPGSTLRSFDVNYRPALHGARNATTLLDLARRADVVFCGVDEAQSLWGVADVPELCDLLRGTGPRAPDLIVVKQGAEGATAVRGGRSWFQAAPRVEVVEPVGAGDAFAAGVLTRLLDGAPIPDCLAEGARLAGVVLGIHGDIPPAPPRVPAACQTGSGPDLGPRPQ